MKLNYLGIVGFAIIVISVIATFIYVRRKRLEAEFSAFSAEEDVKYLQESISMQPNNSAIFEGKPIDQVIIDGISMMQQDNYKMLEGVDLNV